MDYYEWLRAERTAASSPYHRQDHHPAHTRFAMLLVESMIFGISEKRISQARKRLYSAYHRRTE